MNRAIVIGLFVVSVWLALLGAADLWTAAAERALSDKCGTGWGSRIENELNEPARLALEQAVARASKDFDTSPRNGRIDSISLWVTADSRRFVAHVCSLSGWGTLAAAVVTLALGIRGLKSLDHPASTMKS